MQLKAPDFKRNPYPGRYIALEGIDGSGKTSQAEAVVSYFQKQGQEVVITREPRKDSGELYQVINDVLIGKIKLPPLAIQYLFTADRIANQENIIIPALKEGKMVITDRSLWSIIPYSVSDLGLALNETTTEFMLVGQGVLSAFQQTIIPDQTLLLDISVGTAIERISSKSATKEIYEKRGRIEKHYNGYHWLLQQFPKEFTVINGEKSQDNVTKAILKQLAKEKK